MRTVWLTRHGNRLDFVQPAWFETAERRYDPPLCPLGHQQAQELALRLQNVGIQHIFVSPFLRSLQTAQYISQATEVPLKVEAGLGEWHHREWMQDTPKTHPLELCREQFPQIDWTYCSQVIPQYPESLADVQWRTATIAQTLVEQ